MTRRSIAVIGGGISGISAAHILSRAHDVTLLEKNSYLGGHTNTRVIESGPDAGLAVDTGFIVCNEKNYPLLLKFFAELNVPLRDSDMSFGFFCEDSGYRYLGPGFAEFLQMPSNLFNPKFLSMALEQRRFNSAILRQLREGTLGNEPLAAYLARNKASSHFIETYIKPLIASIWSSPAAKTLDFPMATFARFFDNHGMLELSKRPQWKTVVGGSFAYVKAFSRTFRGSVLLDATIARVERAPSEARVILGDGSAFTFDEVVFATHADEALDLLAEPTNEERETLGSWRYNNNVTTLHTDASILPGKPRHWASWNYFRPRETNEGETGAVSITYYMNRLQGLKTGEHYFVTLNDTGRIRSDRVIYSVTYTHPVFTSDSVASQEKIRKLNGAHRTHFCGAYMGYGFHEDGIRSANDVCTKLGLKL